MSNGRNAAPAFLLETAVSTCPPLGFPGVNYVGEKFGRIHSRDRGTRELPSYFSPFSITSATLCPILRPSRVLPSLSLHLHLRRPLPSHLRDAPPHSRRLPRPLLAHPSMVLLAPVIPLSLSLSLFLLREHSPSVSTPDHRRSAFIEPLRAHR